MKLITLTETDWYAPPLLQWRDKILHDPATADLDFTELTWIDLWPLSQLVKLLHSRHIQGKHPPTIALPRWTIEQRKASLKNRALCFLVDIGFISLAKQWHSSFSIGDRSLQVATSDETTCRLSVDSLTSLQPYGYWSKEYKDKIMLPFTVLTDQTDIDTLRDRLWRYVDNFFKYYEREITDGNLIDTFFREIAENAIEHSDGHPAFVAARLIRSVWDLPDEKKRRRMARVRLQGKLPPMQHFLRTHENDGFVELAVVDDGLGIQGTLCSLAPPEAQGSPSIFEYALRSDVSRYDIHTRLSAGKSPLTGLGECANRLEHAEALLVFREKGGTGCTVERSTRQSNKKLVNLKFSKIDGVDGDSTVGCNVQLAIAVSSKARYGKTLPLQTITGAQCRFLHLLDTYIPHSKTIRSNAELPGRTDDHQLPIGSPLLVDVTGIPEDKDSVWHVVARLCSGDVSSYIGPVVLVGVTAPLVSRMTDALAKLRQDENGQSAKLPIGWLAVSSRLEFYYIGSDPSFGSYVLDALSTGHFHQTYSLQFDRGPKFFDWAQLQLRLCDIEGKPSVMPRDIAEQWRTSIGRWVLRHMLETDPSYVHEECVELPNKLNVCKYLDISSFLRNQWVRTAVRKAAELSFGLIQPDIVVTCSSGSRQLCSEIIRHSFHSVRQIDIPDPYSAVPQEQAALDVQSERTLVFADAMFSGSQGRRVVRQCQMLGLNVAAFVAILDSHPEGSADPKLPVAMYSLLRFPSYTAPEAAAPVWRVDPYSSSLRPTRVSTAGPEAFRTREHGTAFYNFVNQQKAILSQHCANAAGHHFLSAIDFRQVIRPDSLNFLIRSLDPVSRGCDVLICPEESMISSVADRIAAKLKIPDDHVIAAVAGRRVGREYAFTTAHEQLLRNVASQGGDRSCALLIDDAMHQGRVITSMAAKLADYGFRRLKAWVFLNNAPPAAPVPTALVVRTDQEITLELHWMFRSFFPAFGSPLTCPECRIATRLKESLGGEGHAIIADYIKYRVSQLKAIDPRTAILDPWRYTTSEAITLPRIDLPIGLPHEVRSAESCNLALLELSQFEEGILALAETFRQSTLPEYQVQIARLLSMHFGVLDKLNLRREFLDSYHRLIGESQGDIGARLLESALLWPADVLVEEWMSLSKLFESDIINGDAGAAVLYAVFKRSLMIGTETDKQHIEQRFRDIRAAIPKASVQRGVILPLLGTLQESTELWRGLRTSLLMLAHRLLAHREPHHRILDRIGELSSALTVKHLDIVLGDRQTSTAISYMAMMMALADIEKALLTLVEYGELSNSGNTAKLLRSLRSFLVHRGQLRQAFHASYRDRQSDLTRLCADLKEDLDRTDVLLRSADDDKRVVEIYSLLKSRFLNPIECLVNPLYQHLQKSARFNIQFTRPPLAQKLLVLADPVLLETIVNHVGLDVDKHSPHSEEYTLFPSIEVTLSYRITEDRLFVLTIVNPTADPEAERKFRAGRSHRQLSLDLHKYGGSHKGSKVADTFVTEIQLQAV